MFGAAVAVSRLYSVAYSNCGSAVVPTLFKKHILQKLSHLNPYQLTPRNQYFSSWKTVTLNNSSSCKKNICGWKNHGRQSFIQLKIFQVGKSTYVNPSKVNTNIINNVMLYRYEKPYIFKLALAFGIIGFIGCLVMADNVFVYLCKDLLNAQIDWKTRLYAHILPLTAMGIGIVGGPAILLLVWFVTKRTIKYIVLHSGGKKVTFVTYHPVRGETKFSVPLSYVSCSSARLQTKSYIPLKIKNRSFRYIVDKNGNFVNPDLFDSTVAINRFN